MELSTFVLLNYALQFLILFSPIRGTMTNNQSANKTMARTAIVRNCNTGGNLFMFAS
jgi:hypothetical protein